MRRGPTTKEVTERKCPQFVHWEAVKEFQEELFDRFVCHDKAQRELFVTSILVRNSRVLLTGNPEAGKTTLVRLIAKGISRDNASNGENSPPIYAKVTGAPEQTLQKVISTTNISKLITEGKEEIIVRPIVKARIKFLNEINRFSKAIQDSFLSLLEEKEIEYGGNIFKTPDFICFADMNPHRGKIDLALKTRFMVSVFMPFVDLRGDISILDNMFFSGSETTDLTESMPEILSMKDLNEIWDDVQRIKVPEYVKTFLSALISAFKVCKHDKSQIMPGYLRTVCQKCEFKNEICSHIKKIPGERASIAGILYTRARAWLHHREKINIEDVKWVVPWVIAHRIQLSSAVKSEVPNPWKWCKEAVTNLLKTKWYYSNQGEENYGIWVKGFTLVAFGLDWELQPKFKRVLDKFYPNLDPAEENAKLDAIRKLRDLAFGGKEGGRGDLVLQEIYKMGRKNFKRKSQEVIKRVKPKIEEILEKEDATLKEVLKGFKQLKKTLPEESSNLRQKLQTKLEKLTVRVSLKFPGRTAKAKTLLNELNFSKQKINDLIGEKVLKIQNENARVKFSGEFLIFRAKNPETANLIRQKFS